MPEKTVKNNQTQNETTGLGTERQIVMSPYLIPRSRRRPRTVRIPKGQRKRNFYFVRKN